MTDLLETLRRLATRFVARDIMRPKDQLACAEDHDGACRLLEQNPQYDVIPLRQGDRLVGFLERGSTKAKTIQIQHVVSAGTPITELVDSLCDRRLLFVVGRHEVGSGSSRLSFGRSTICQPFVPESLTLQRTNSLNPMQTSSGSAESERCA